MRTYRVDFAGSVGKPKLLTDGSLRVTARIARTGIQTYKVSDGQSVQELKEYRPPETVFAKDSMESWPALAVTVGHPSEPVTAGNWSTLAKGHVGDVIRQDGQFLTTDLVIKDAATIKRIQEGELVEVSAGYFVDVEAKAGTTSEGQRYDTVQRKVTGNHVALGPKGWGRAGPDVRLFAGDAANKVRTGVHYPCDETLKGDSTHMEITKEQLDKVTAERDAALAQVKTLEGQVTAKVEEAVKAHDSKLADRVTLRTSAVQADNTKDKTITKLAMDSTKTDREVMVAVITSQDSEFKADGRSDEYVRCRFDLAVQEQAKGTVKTDSAAKQAEADKLAALAAGGQRMDGGEDLITKARNKMIEEHKGLALGKGK